MIAALALLRGNELHVRERAAGTTGGLAGGLIEGFRYIGRRPDLQVLLLMLLMIGTFGLNFPIYIATMSVTVFHGGADQYGLLSTVMAIGSVAGALLAARRAQSSIEMLLAAAALFGVGCILAALAPNVILFGAALVVIGIAAQTFTTSTNALVQLSTEPAMRGRVMAILLAIALGGMPIGAPIVGRVADHFGPRWALAVAAGAGFAAAAIATIHLMRGTR